MSRHDRFQLGDRRRGFGLAHHANVDHGETKARITREHTLIGLVYTVGADRFDLRLDAVLGTEIDHLLGLGYAAAARASERAPIGQKVDRRQAQGFLLAAADIDERSIQRQQANMASISTFTGTVETIR